MAEGRPPIRLEGEVRWCQFERPGYETENGLYNTGVKLLRINGRSIPETIHYDQAYHIIWSAALESILGNIKEYAGKGKPAA